MSPFDCAHGFGRFLDGGFRRLGEAFLGSSDYFNHFLSHIASWA